MVECFFDPHNVGSGFGTEETRSSVINSGKVVSVRVSLFWLSPAYAGNRLRVGVADVQHFVRRDSSVCPVCCCEFQY